MNGPTRKAFLSRQEAADQLSVSLSTLIRHIADGRVPHINIGARVLIPAQFVDDMVREALAASDEGGR